MNNFNNNQQDSKWSTILLGDSTLTIGADGCVVSAIGDAIGTTPDVVNSLLKQNDGFDGPLVIWAKLAAAFPGITAIVHNVFDNNAILASLAAGNRVLVFVSAAPIGGTGEHCVEYIGNQQLKDPWTGQIRPTSDFPNVLGEWVEIQGAWQQPQSSAVNTEGLNTYGLDPTNEQSNQVVFDTFHKVQQGLYIPVEQFNQAQQTIGDLQKDILDLQSKHNGDQKELVNLNSALAALTTSNKEYATHALDAEKVADTYTGYMDDIAETVGISNNNQTDQQLHDEIIKEIILLHQNQKTAESNPSPQETQIVWKDQLQNIVNWLLKNGFKDFLIANNFHVVDPEGNIVDDSIADRVIAFLDDRFSRLDILQKAQDALAKAGAKVVQSRGLLDSVGTFFSKIKGLFVTSA